MNEQARSSARYLVNGPLNTLPEECNEQQNPCAIPHTHHQYQQHQKPKPCGHLYYLIGLVVYGVAATAFSAFSFLRVTVCPPGPACPVVACLPNQLCMDPFLERCSYGKTCLDPTLDRCPFNQACSDLSQDRCPANKACYSSTSVCSQGPFQLLKPLVRFKWNGASAPTEITYPTNTFPATGADLVCWSPPSIANDITTSLTLQYCKA